MHRLLMVPISINTLIIHKVGVSNVANWVPTEDDKFTVSTT